MSKARIYARNLAANWIGQAAGLPVVSSPIPEVKGYAHLAEIADNPNEFVAAVESALACEKARRLERVEAMALETWPRKVAEIGERLEGGSRGAGSGDCAMRGGGE
jgi:hypothetical protein